MPTLRAKARSARDSGTSGSSANSPISPPSPNLPKTESVIAQLDLPDQQDLLASQVQMDLSDQPVLPDRTDFPELTE